LSFLHTTAYGVHNTSQKLCEKCVYLPASHGIGLFEVKIKANWQGSRAALAVIHRGVTDLLKRERC